MAAVEGKVGLAQLIGSNYGPASVRPCLINTEPCNIIIIEWTHSLIVATISFEIKFYLEESNSSMLKKLFSNVTMQFNSSTHSDHLSDKKYK